MQHLTFRSDRDFSLAALRAIALVPLRRLRTLAKLASDEEGNALIVVLVCMGVLMGFAALSLDIGQVLHTKSQLQTLADSMAVAGALEVQQCGSTSNCTVMQNAVKAAMAENGHASGSYAFGTQCSGTAGTGITLTLNNGPCYLGPSDPNSGNASFVEAVVSKPQDLPFAAFIGVRQFNLVARAEAGSVNDSNCIYVSANNTSTSAGTAFTANSGAHITSSCGIVDDSGANAALMANSGAHISAPSIDVHGTTTSNNGSHFDNAQPSDNSLAVPDPLSGLPEPSGGSCTNLIWPNGKKTLVINQGTYCGINVNSSNTLTLNPGTYVFTGNVAVDSGASLAGSGVTLYFSSGSMLANSGSTVNIIAPTSGTYAGIVLFQSKTDSAGMVLDSGSKSAWQGAIYLPDASLEINSGGNTAAYTIVDVESLIVDSGAKFDVGNDYSSLGGHSPLRVWRLMQ